MSEKVVIREEIRELSKPFAGAMKFDENGSVKLDNDLYLEALKSADLDADTVKRVQDFHGNLVSAVGLAVGEAGTKFLKKNKELDSVSAEIRFGNDHMVSNFYRSKQYGAGPGSEEKITKYGELVTRYTAHGSANKGTLAKVRQHLNALAADALA